MKRTPVKPMALLLALILCLSASFALADDIGAYGWEKPEETYSFSVYLGTADPQSKIDLKEKSGYAMDNWLLENMNVKIEEEWFMDSQEQRISLMLLDGSYPDLLGFTTEAASAMFVSAGRAIDLAPLLEEYGQNILAEMGPYIELFKDEDGHIYRLPSHWGYKVDSTIALSFSARYDWWLELDTELYTTTEEYYEQMKQMLANHPTNENGEKVYALTDYDGGAAMKEALLGAWGFIEGMKLNEDGTMSHWMFTEEGKELCAYINRFWREDMIDPDFVTNGFDDWKAMGVNDRLAGDLGLWWRTFVMGHEYWQEVDPDVDINKRYLNAQATAPDVENNSLATMNMLCTDVTNGAYWCITDKCADPASLMKWLNWEWSPYGTMVVQYGYPDEGNVYDIVDGKIVFKDEALDASKKNLEWHAVLEKYDRGLYWLTTRRSYVNAGVNPMPFDIDERVIWNNWGTGDLYPKTPDGSRYLDDGWEICWGFYDMDTAVDTTLYNAIFDADSYEFIVNQNVRDLEKTYWINIVTANSEDDCMAMLEEAKAVLQGADIDTLLAFRANTYQENLRKVSGAE